MQPLSQIRQIDYTVIFARDIDAMRDFYETIMEFPLLRADSNLPISRSDLPESFATAAKRCI